MKIKKTKQAVGIVGTVVDTLDITGENYVPNVDAVNQEFEKINKWIEVGNIKGSAKLSLPNNWNELFVMIWVRDSETATGRKFTFNIFKELDINIGNYNPSYSSGTALTSEAIFGASFVLEENKTKIRINEAYGAGKNVMSTSHMKVWYR